ncbi:MAG: hypothetical protein K1X79_06130 [Oligoflexia bacterium]|nr:hypothetical protein [Oligoflexia bacterium]
MIFGRSSGKHPLPKFPPKLISRFRSLCESLPISSLSQLRSELVKAVEAARTQSDRNPRVNRKRLEDIASRAMMLIDVYGNFPPDKQALIIGALRYFAIADDELSDEVFCTGLDDDAKVFNHVLEQLGIDEQYIEL